MRGWGVREGKDEGREMRGWGAREGKDEGRGNVL